MRRYEVIYRLIGILFVSICLLLWDVELMRKEVERGGWRSVDQTA